jgi:hypothetical protein
MRSIGSNKLIIFRYDKLYSWLEGSYYVMIISHNGDLSSPDGTRFWADIGMPIFAGENIMPPYPTSGTKLHLCTPRLPPETSSPSASKTYSTTSTRTSSLNQSTHVMKQI